jgi:hypothetical protein
MSTSRPEVPTATERRSGVDRRHAPPARPRNSAVGPSPPALSPDLAEFQRAIDAYKRDHRRPNPTCAEVMEVFLSLGYTKAGKKRADSL